jgi:hypothetical protein
MTIQEACSRMTSALKKSFEFNKEFAFTKYKTAEDVVNLIRDFFTKTFPNQKFEWSYFDRTITAKGYEFLTFNIKLKDFQFADGKRRIPYVVEAVIPDKAKVKVLALVIEDLKPISDAPVTPVVKFENKSEPKPEVPSKSLVGGVKPLSSSQARFMFGLNEEKISLSEFYKVVDLYYQCTSEERKELRSYKPE